MQCPSNTVNFHQNSHNRHPYGVSIVSSISDLCSVSVIAVMHGISYFIEPCYDDTRLYEVVLMPVALWCLHIGLPTYWLYCPRKFLTSKSITFQYKDSVSMYWDFHCKDKMILWPFTGLPTVTEFQYFAKEMRTWVRKFSWIFGSKYWNFWLFFHNYRMKILRFGEMLLKILKL